MSFPSGFLDDFNCFREVDSSALAVSEGIAVAIKDSMDVRGMQSLHGSPLFANEAPATVDATVVERLRAQGARIVGKTHMTELACGTDGLNVHFGDVLNPHDPERHAGGSSSGSAASVAAGIVPLALGSDTGGSIRVPAAACGVVGLKPSYGRVPNDGMSVGASHLDHIGPIASSVEHARWGLAAVEDPGWSSDSLDPATATFGILQGPFLDECEPDVVKAFETAIPAIEALGGTVLDVNLGLDLVAVDDHANALSRDLYDAYGSLILQAPPELVGDELRSWIELFTDVDPATYAAAVRERSRLISVLNTVMAEIDVLVCPTMRSGVCLRSEAGAQPRDLRTANLVLFNMTGQPSLTIPWGVDDSDMPLGLLLTGRNGEDYGVLDVAERLERA